MTIRTLRYVLTLIIRIYTVHNIIQRATLFSMNDNHGALVISALVLNLDVG